MTVSEPRPAFVPISPNPFIVGNPVRDRSMFFGREAEFESVRSRFQEAGDCGLLVFCGERRSGKTSILFQILDRRLGPEFIPVFIDMQSVAISNEAEFLGMVAEEVLLAFGDRAKGISRPEFGVGRNHATTFRKFIESVLQHCPDRKLILLFDEYELFEHKIDSGVLSRDTLGILSNLMEHRSVFLVFTGSQHLDKRHRDYWSILLGKSTWKQISYLERSDAERLVREPVAGRVTYSKGTVDAIFRLAAGQPFYTQALCQGLVDQLNERRTREVTAEVLDEVVRGLVNNPLPQMIFLWDSLGGDEKLTLALLSEALADDTDAIGVPAITKLMHRREYPLDLTRGRIAAALEALFRAELLTRDDRLGSPRYAFRMDLWRLWLRRMHSGWQVMRELGLPIRPRPGLRIGPYRIAPRAAGIAVTALAAIALSVWLRSRESVNGSSGGSPNVGSSGNYTLVVRPPVALIEAPGLPPETGTLRATLGADRDHAIRITAPGYADTSHVARVPRGANRQDTISMRALFGDLLVETTPTGAQIAVDGKPHGPSPLLIRSLPLAGSHHVTAALPGHRPVQQPVQLVRPAGVNPLRLALTASTRDVVVTSEPSGATVVVDGRSPVTTPGTLSALKYGQHHVSARLAGYKGKDETLDVSDATGVVHFLLEAEPPGFITIEGNLPATMYLDGENIANDVPNSKPQRVSPGTHQVRVVLASGSAITRSIDIKPGERLIFDFSKLTVTSRP